MKLIDVINNENRDEFVKHNYNLPRYDIKKVRENTKKEPTWIHFGAGNIFRAFPAAVLNEILNKNEYGKGVIVAESFDYDIIDEAYRPYDNLSLLVSLKSTKKKKKTVIASVTESLKADKSFKEDWDRLVEVFKAPSLAQVTFTITEKGYGAPLRNKEKGFDA